VSHLGIPADTRLWKNPFATDRGVSRSVGRSVEERETMPKQPVKLDDLRSLCRLANQSAELMMSYIHRGYSPEEIAETFSTIFFDQLTLKLDPDTAARFPRVQHGQPPLDQRAAAEQFILIVADAFLKVTIKRLEAETGTR
jgi:hypothetical protein